MYVCTLISRGDIQSANNVNAFQTSLSSVNPYNSELSSVKSEGIKQEVIALIQFVFSHIMFGLLCQHAEWLSQGFEYVCNPFLLVESRL